MFKNLAITCFLGACAVIMGAFAAHELKETLLQSQYDSIQTAVRYQMFHVLALLFVNGYKQLSRRQKNAISFFFILGIFLFSGSIYVIQLTFITAKNIWFITPLGGVCFVIGWCLLSLLFIKKINLKD